MIFSAYIDSGMLRPESKSERLHKSVSIMLKSMSFCWLVVIALICQAFASASEPPVRSGFILAEDVKWGYLNPLRGDKSPGAANLWGDRTKAGSTGMLVRFKKGFSSPPHIHNVSYRGLVINGLVHNDDPNAEKLWMPSGSFWTQPAGENHITAANAENNLIFLEIESGPYLVKPKEELFDNGERPVNVHASNVVWMDATESSWITATDVDIAKLWKSRVDNTKLSGVMIRLAKGFEGNISTYGDEFRGVVITGKINYKNASSALSPGSYFFSQGTYSHSISTDEISTVYIRSSDSFTVNAH